jgi:transcriptional regulator GlxA family with amidase domain
MSRPAQEPPVTTTVALLLFPGCDLLDVGGPYEVLLTANRLARRGGAPPPFSVATVSGDGRSVTSYGGMGLRPTAAIDAVGHPDVVVVPGAVDVAGVLADDALLSDVRDLTDVAGIVTSVCTGAFLLAATGRLEGRRATTHHEDLAELAARDDVGEVLEARWVDDGEVVTAGGLSNGIAMCLHLVDRLASRELAIATAAQLAYPWEPEGPTA